MVENSQVVPLSQFLEVLVKFRLFDCLLRWRTFWDSGRVSHEFNGSPWLRSRRGVGDVHGKSGASIDTCVRRSEKVSHALTDLICNLPIDLISLGVNFEIGLVPLLNIIEGDSLLKLISKLLDLDHVFLVLFLDIPHVPLMMPSNVSHVFSVLFLYLLADVQKINLFKMLSDSFGPIGQDCYFF